jgi:hypothetical protein
MYLLKRLPGVLSIYEGGRLIEGKDHGDDARRAMELAKFLTSRGTEIYSRFNLGELRGVAFIMGRYGYVSHGNRLLIVDPEAVDWNEVIHGVMGNGS